MGDFTRDPVLENSLDFIRKNKDHPAMTGSRTTTTLLQVIDERDRELVHYKKKYSEVDRAYSDSLWEGPHETLRVHGGRHIC